VFIWDAGEQVGTTLTCDAINGGTCKSHSYGKCLCVLHNYCIDQRPPQLKKTTTLEDANEDMPARTEADNLELLPVGVIP
jgi:hypothetical protein